MVAHDRHVGGPESRGGGPWHAVLWVALLALLPALALSEEDPKKGEEATGPQWRAAAKGLEARGISCLRIHPKDRDVLWAHVHGLGPCRSVDGGRTWEVRLEGVAEKDRPGLRSQVRLALDPSDEKVLYLTIDGQIYRSENAGVSWSSITSGALTSLSWDNLRHTHLSWEVRVDPKKGVHLLVGTRNDGDHHGGLYESTNAGKSWEELSGSAQPESGLGHDTMFVRMNPSSDKYVTVAGRSAVWWSDSRGREFERNDPGSEGIHDIRGLSEFSGKTLYLADARGIWRSKNGGERWDKAPIRTGDAIAVVPDPHSKKRLYGVFYDRGVEMSEDSRNDKWVPWGAPAVEEGEEPPEAGLKRQVIREILVQPRDRRELYYASPLTGLWKSDDGGKTVVPLTAPEDAAAGTTIPVTIPSMAVAAVHASEAFTHLAVTDEGFVFRSTDRGDSWTAAGPLGMVPLGLVPDPAPGTWIAYGRRLMRSTDDGLSWTLVWPPESGKPKVDPEERIVAVHRETSSEGGVQRAGALHVLLERTGEVWSSGDDGATWTVAHGPKFPSSDTWAADLAVDPGDPAHWVMAARTVREAPNPRDDNGGIYETWDAGKTWKDVSDALRPDKKADADERRRMLGWNRADSVVIDREAGLVLYAADRRGLFGRALGLAKDKERAPWIDLTPTVAEGAAPVPAQPDVAAMSRGRGADGKGELVMQLAGRNGETALVAQGSAALGALYAALQEAGDAGATDEARKAHTWTVMASPSAGMALSALQHDRSLPGRLIATERSGQKGVIVFETPGSKPGGAKPPAEPDKKEEPKKDDAKKDDAKKDDAKKGEPGKDTSTAAPRVPEGMRAFTAGADKTWRVWGVDTGESNQQFVGHENAVRCIALAPDETSVATSSDDRTIRFWDAANGKPLASVPCEAGVRGLVFDDDSAFLYAAGGESNHVLQVDVAARTVKAFAGHKGAVLCVAASEDPNRVYSGSADHVILVWDTRKGAEVNSIVYGGPVQALAVSADGSRIYAAGDAGSVAAFDAAGKPAGRLEGLAAPAEALALDPGGGLLYASAPEAVLAIDTATMTVRTTHAAPGAGGITCVATSVDGVWILAGDAQGGLWLWARGHPEAFRARAQKHEGAIHAVAVTTEETALAAAPGGAAREGDGGKDDGGGDGAKPDEPKPEEPKKGEPAPDPAKPGDGGSPDDKPSEPKKPDEPK